MFAFHLIRERETQMCDAEARVELERALCAADRFVVLSREKKTETVDPIAADRKRIENSDGSYTVVTWDLSRGCED